MNAHLKIVVVDRDELDARVCASLRRALRHARIEKKLAVFTLMARTAADNIAARRQQYLEELWAIAEEHGLVSCLGATSVASAIDAGYGGTL
jgi:hypothetical protein